MEKTNDGVKCLLKERYQKACNAYLRELLRMWELDERYGYWNSDQPGTIYHYGETHNLSMEDIIYIVENDIEEDEVLAWEDYTLNAHEFGVFDKLFDLKADLKAAVEEEKKRCSGK